MRPLPALVNLVAGLLLLALAAGLLWSFDPLNRRRAAELRAQSNEAEASVAHAQTRGAREASNMLGAAARQAASAEAAAAATIAAARQAEDANAPVDPKRADRIHNLDRRLCELSPELQGCAADRAARGGEAAVQPDGAAH